MIIEENVLLLQECVTSFNFYQIKTFPKIFLLLMVGKDFSLLIKIFLGKFPNIKQKFHCKKQTLTNMTFEMFAFS